MELSLSDNSVADSREGTGSENISKAKGYAALFGPIRYRGQDATLLVASEHVAKLLFLRTVQHVEGARAVEQVVQIGGLNLDRDRMISIRRKPGPTLELDLRATVCCAAPDEHLQARIHAVVFSSFVAQNELARRQERVQRCEAFA